MRRRANCLAVPMVVAAALTLAAASAGADGTDPVRQWGEDRWVPSFAIVSGVTVQKQQGDVRGENLPGGDNEGSLGVAGGDDIAVSPFVGGSIELMTPAIPIPTRPRFFVSGMILPTFSTELDLATEGNPGCVRGPEPDAPCAATEDGSRRRGFPESAANGTGAQTSLRVSRWMYGADLGISWPLQIGERQVRIKPSFSWINYKVRMRGLVVDAICDPENLCTDVTPVPGGPTARGFMRETTLQATDSQRLNAIGPGLDIEVDAARMGPVGLSLFIGGRAYRLLDDRKISAVTRRAYDDQVGQDVSEATFRVELEPWIYRGHVGIRFQWLGDD